MNPTMKVTTRGSAHPRRDPGVIAAAPPAGERNARPKGHATVPLELDDDLAGERHRQQAQLSPSERPATRIRQTNARVPSMSEVPRRDDPEYVQAEYADDRVAAVVSRRGGSGRAGSERRVGVDKLRE